MTEVFERMWRWVVLMWAGCAAFYALTVVATLAMLQATEARAGCVCACVDGRVVSLCRYATGMALPCSPVICPLSPPLPAPLGKAWMLPPDERLRGCHPRHVFDPATGSFGWVRCP